MRVLLLNGSPRADQCTATALKEMADTLEQEGVETVTLQVGKGPVRGCIGCGGCRGKNRWVFNDDMANTVIEEMEKADGLVIGSPVYYASANGTLSALLDRVFYAGNCFAYKPACVITSARRAGTTATYDQLNKYIGISGMLQVPSCYWNMVHGSCHEDVLQDKEGLRIMRTLARNMAWMLKMLASSDVPRPEKEPMIRTNFIR